MEVTVQIPFPQLLKAVKSLSSLQKVQLTKELSQEEFIDNDKAAFMKMLLNGQFIRKMKLK